MAYLRFGIFSGWDSLREMFWITLEDSDIDFEIDNRNLSGLRA